MNSQNSISRRPGRFGRMAVASLAMSLFAAGSASAQTCIQDAYTAAGNQQGLNCTANDFAVSNVTVTQVLDDGCAFDGDTFTFNGVFNIAAGSTDRYDVGFYIGADGTQALTGDCAVRIIPNNISNIDGDTCGDYNGTAIQVPVSNVTVACSDSNGDGFFDLALCSSYDQNAGDTCSGPSNAVPGAPSKCDCAQVETTLQTPHCEDDSSLCNAIDDANPCTTLTCNSRASGLGNLYGCSNNNNTLPCDDGLFCNGTDTCSGGTCSGHTGDPCIGGGICGDACNESLDNCFDLAGTTCRAAAGVCDTAEACTGSSAACPADTFSSGNTCRAANGVCDVAETCSGSSASCPANGFAVGGTCRAANGVCDVAESCSGSSASCPADGFAVGGTCRGSNGVCDVAETCSGSSANCPADVFAVGTTCRADAGVCDVAETCSGSAASCPADSFEPSGTACTSDGNVCTDDECDGSGACVNTNNTDPCDDGLFCTTADVCSGGSCGGSALDCSDAVDCTVDSCDEDANACVNAANDAACDDGDACTEDICSEVNGCISNLICEDVCRSPGYWSTHSGYEKAKQQSINVGQLVVDAAGGLQVCGQTVTATANPSEPWVDGLGLSSSLEGLCMKARGVKQRQLYRQLMAATLNCVMSNGNDCDDITARYIEVSYDACNALCETGIVEEDGPSVGECVGQLGCFNSGGQVINGQCAKGTCASQPDLFCGKDYGDCPLFEDEPQDCVPFEDNCHDNALCKEAIGVCPKATPAASPRACNEARHNDCTIDSCN